MDWNDYRVRCAELLIAVHNGDLAGDDHAGLRDDNAYTVVTADHLAGTVILELQVENNSADFANLVNGKHFWSWQFMSR